MSEYLNFETLLAFLTLTILEIVLGIDNIIFIAIQSGHLPPHQRDQGRRFGLMLAVISRILLLLGISWVMQLKTGLFQIWGHEFTGRDLVVLVGGVFLMRQATREIHSYVEHRHHSAADHTQASSLGGMLFNVAVMDIVFSLDSVITAVGMSKQIPVMIAAVLVSVAVMLAYSGMVVRFVDRNPTIKLLALSFLLLIGVLLVAEGFHQEIDKGYVYFAMAFSLGIELLQMRADFNSKKHSVSATADHRP